MFIRLNNTLVSATRDMLYNYSKNNNCFFLYMGKRLTIPDISNMFESNNIIDIHFRLYGGGKGSGHSSCNRHHGQVKRELVFKTQNESDYALVSKVLGNKRVETMCYADGKVRQCKIAGSCNGWIIKDDTVLISFRPFDTTKGDVIHKYTTDEVRILTRAGYIISNDIHKKDTQNISFVDMNNVDKTDDEVGANPRRYDMPTSDSDSNSDIDAI
jgi:translation initiation factor 1A